MKARPGAVCLWLLLGSSAAADTDLMQCEPWQACEYCHGSEGRIDSAQVPAIAGQSVSYIKKQLSDFRAGRRASPEGQMRSAMLLLDEADDAAVAGYFSSLPDAAPPSTEWEATSTGVAAKLFWQGDGQRPACVTCHAASRDDLFDAHPHLIGMNRDYLARQLRAFRDGRRANDINGVMRQQAAALNDDQIDALAAYLAGSGGP